MTFKGMSEKDDLNTEEPRMYTEDELQQMRSAGMEKPKEITWSQWLSPKKLNSRHHIVCYMAASGMKNDAIARHTGLSKSRLSTLLNNPKFRMEIQAIQKQMFLSDPQQQFNRLIGDAISTTEEIMKSQTEKGATRLAAANLVIERSLGKSVQTIDLGQNLIRSLFEKMDQKEKNAEAIDVSIERPEALLLPESTSGDNVEEEESEPEQAEKPSEIDSWINSNLKGE